jgi:predicted permease
VLKLGTSRLVNALKEGGRGGSSGRERHRARNALVVSQVAMALVLLVGSGLMIRSFIALRQVHPGFERPGEVLTLRISIPAAEIEEHQLVAATHEQIQQQLAEIPGVVAVGASSSVTMDGWQSNDPIYVEERPVEDKQMPPLRRFKWITPGYFMTMENPLLAGRAITWADIHGRAKVVMVSESFTREYWDSPADAIGKRIRQAPLDPWREIVGVVGSVRDDGVDQEAPALIYWPMLLESFWGQEIVVQRSLCYAVRSNRAGSEQLLRDVREAIWSVNPNLPLANVRLLSEILDGSMARASFTLVLLAIAASAALLLGIVGIYGVTSYTVSLRTREFGVRMVLGAQGGDVSRLVIRQGLLLGGLGVLAGTVAAFALTRLMAALLFGVSPLDPVTYGAVAMILLAIAALASYLPARRAAAVDPLEALRRE